MPLAQGSRSTLAVIPAYNCGDTIAQVIEGVRRRGLEVVVVDDGSADETRETAEAAGATTIVHPTNLGKGHALVSGFTHALARGASEVLTLDADGQHDPEDLPALLQHGGADLVIGQRKVDLEVMPRTSFVGNCISTFFISMFCGKQFPDTQCGYRVYSRRLLTSIPLKGGHFETETELLMRASLLGLTIRWVPIETVYDNGVTPHRTNFNNLFDSLRVIRVVVSSPRFPRKGS
jgi:glycosyltransferase involved in cell wall biosynthesis